MLNGYIAAPDSVKLCQSLTQQRRSPCFTKWTVEGDCRVIAYEFRVSGAFDELVTNGFAALYGRCSKGKQSKARDGIVGDTRYDVNNAVSRN